MSKECFLLGQNNFKAGRVKHQDEKGIVPTQPTPPVTCIPCDAPKDNHLNPNRLFNFYKLKHLVENNLECKSCNTSKMNIVKERFMKMLEKSLDKNGIKDKTKEIF